MRKNRPLLSAEAGFKIKEYFPERGFYKKDSFPAGPKNKISAKTMVKNLFKAADSAPFHRFIDAYDIIFKKRKGLIHTEEKQCYIKRIRDLREDRDLRQVDIAAVLGTSRTMYARYERGAAELPLRHLVALCRFYNVSADYILGI